MTDVTSRPELLDLGAKYSADHGEFFFTGVQAIVRMLFDQMRADRRNKLNTAAFVSGYQGSPLGGFDRELQGHKAILDQLNIVHKPGLNEDLGATAVMGSQLVSTMADALYDGVLGVWYGKAPGLDRAGDAIRHAQFAGTSKHGGVLALTGDDPACKSSTLPSSSENALADLNLPILYPGTVQEILDMGRHGVAISRATGLWQAIKIITPVADGAGTGLIDLDRVTPVVPPFEYRGVPYQTQVSANFIPPYTHDAEREMVEARLPFAKAYVAANPGINEVVVDPPNPWLTIVASGHTFGEVTEALGRLGLGHAELHRHGVRLARLGMIFPVEPGFARRIAAGVEELLVVEEKRAFVENQLKTLLYGVTGAPQITGKNDRVGNPLLNAYGVIETDALMPVLERQLRQKLSAEVVRLPEPRKEPYRKNLELLPSRSPFFCSGCPHNTSTQVPEGAVVGGGIGCHGMVLLMDPKRVGNVVAATQMGGEGTQWVGMEPFVKTDHFIQNVGDGTFFHSGSLALRAAIAAGAHVTYKILYNGTVAMTGGQDVGGAMAVPELATALRAEGVNYLIITTDDRSKYKDVKLPANTEVWDRDRVIEAQEKLATISGVTVLIHDQQCAAEKRRDRKRGQVADPAMRIVINERVCEGCGDCGEKSNCLSVQPIDTEFGRKTQIHQSSCNKDYSCLKGDCPSFLSVMPKKPGRFTKTADVEKARRAGGARRRPALEATDIPAPTMIVPVDDVTVRMPGIGGTGVVTVSQILGTAAMLDGKYVWGLDQTGLSQKAGPVVSDLRIAAHPIEGSNKVTAGSVDLYLIFDLLVGLAPANLVGAASERTVAVASTAKTPTGAMIRDTAVTYPDEAVLRADIDAVTRADLNIYLDAQELAEGLFGETTTANLLVLGAAYQRGALPIGAEAIEQAIETNGVAVEANKLAFRWGRMWVADPERVMKATVTPDAGLAEPSAEDLALIGDLDQGELGRLLRIRVPDLVLYQDRGYAKKYVETVRKVAAAEAKASPGSTAFAENVARYLYKLMAYKDEYEVARLHLETAAKATVDREVGGEVTVRYNLHPPMLKALGLDHKIELGEWFTPALAALAKGKRLRGTPADPFGYAKVRRVERKLVKEYRDAVERIASRLTSAQVSAAAELAALPDVVRGYEDVKLANVERYEARLAELKLQLGI